MLTPQQGEDFGDRVEDREPELDTDNNQPLSAAYYDGAIYVSDEGGQSEDELLHAYAVGETRLSDITVDGVSVPGFSPNEADVEYGVSSGASQVTVDATVLHSGAVVAFAPDDADTNTDGHQVNLSDGRNIVTVTVTHGSATQDYTLDINREVRAQYGWAAHHDIDTLKKTGNSAPWGIWSNDTTIWVLNDDDDKIYAYVLSTGERDAAKDFDTLEAAGNTEPRGIWSDGTTMWVSNDGTGAQNKIYAYQMSDKSHDSDKDFDTLSDGGTGFARGLWSDNTTMWVANDGLGDANKIYAYQMSDKELPTTDKDFDTLQDGADNGGARGIWSDEHHHVGGERRRRRRKQDIRLQDVRHGARLGQGLRHSERRRQQRSQRPLVRRRYYVGGR